MWADLQVRLQRYCRADLQVRLQSIARAGTPCSIIAPVVERAGLRCRSRKHRRRTTCASSARRRRRHGRLRADQGRRQRRDARGRAVSGTRRQTRRCSSWPYDSPRRGAVDAGARLRRVRRLHRRVDDRRRAVHDGRRASGSTGIARGCWAAARITGAASRCASAPTTSSTRASTGSATTGRSPTTTSSRTTTSSIELVGIFGSNEGIHNEPDGIFLPPPKPRCYELLIKQASDKLNIPCIPSRLSILTQAHNGRAAVPLLRPVRPRLRDALELLVDLGLPAARAGHRQAEDHHRRHGARGADRTPTAWPPACPTSTRRTRASTRCAPRPWCWPPAPASRRG